MRWQEWMEHSRALIGDQKSLLKLLDQALRKAQRLGASTLKEVTDDIYAVLRLVKAWSKGYYTEIPKRSILLAVMAIVYFLSPVDAIPDFLPGVGYIDDLEVLRHVLQSIKGDLSRFKAWESDRGESRS